MRAPWPTTPWMDEDCFGVNIPWDAATPMCWWIPQFLRTPQLQNVFGLLQFDVFGDSREFCNPDIVVPLTRMQAEGKGS